MATGPSTVGLAMTFAVWILVLLFILLGSGFSILAAARAGALRGRQANSRGIVVAGAIPAAVSAGLGFEGHPAWAIGISLLVILFCFWWMHNMGKND